MQQYFTMKQLKRTEQDMKGMKTKQRDTRLIITAQHKYKYKLRTLAIL